MADKTTTALTVAGALDGTELLAIVQGGNSRKLTVLVLSTALLGATVLPGATVTTSKPLIDHTQTWNAGGVSFAGWQLNITATASAAASVFLNFLKASVSQFKVDKNGVMFAGDGAGGPAVGVPGMAFVGAPQVGFRRSGTTGLVMTASGADIWFAAASNINMRSNGTYGWTPSSDPQATADLVMSRSAPNVMRVWNNANSGAVLAAAHRVDADHFNAQTGTTYTLVAADNGKTVTLNNASPITVTVPASLGAGFSVTLAQIGAGQVTIAASGTTLNSYNSLVKIAGQHGVASLLATAADVFNLSGNLSA